MKRFLTLVFSFLFLISVLPAAAEDVPASPSPGAPAPAEEKKTGTENAMMKGKGLKKGLKKHAMKKGLKKGMKKGMKKGLKKGLKKMDETPASRADSVSPAAPPVPVQPAAPAPTAPVTSAAQTHTVNIENFAFGTATLNVKVGDTVKWMNLDTTAHTVDSDDGTTFKSGDLSSKTGTYSFTFTKAGSFAYHCSYHPSMKATVVVSQ